MSLIRRMLAHFGIVRQLPTSEDQRAAKHQQTLRKADRVIEDYRKLDATLRIVVKR